MNETTAWVIVAALAAYVAIRVVEAKESGAKEAGYAAGKGAVDEAVNQARNILSRPPASFAELVGA